MVQQTPETGGHQLLVDPLRRGYELSKQFFAENLGPQLTTSTPEGIIAQYNAIMLPRHPNSRGFSITPEVIKGIETAQDFARGLKDLGFDLTSLPQLSEVQQKLQQAKVDLGIRSTLPDAEALKKISVIQSLANKLGLSANTPAELTQKIRACGRQPHLGIDERRIKIPNVETVLNIIFDRYRNTAEAIGMEGVKELQEKPKLRNGRPVIRQGHPVTHRVYVVDIATVISEVDGFVGHVVEAGVADARNLPMNQLIQEISQYGQILDPSGTPGKPIETARRLHIAREEAVINHVVGAETLTMPELAEEIRREAVAARLVDATNAANEPIETILTGMSGIRTQAAVLGLMGTLQEMSSQVPALIAEAEQMGYTEGDLNAKVLKIRADAELAGAITGSSTAEKLAIIKTQKDKAQKNLVEGVEVVDLLEHAKHDAELLGAKPDDIQNAKLPAVLDYLEQERGRAVTARVENAVSLSNPALAEAIKKDGIEMLGLRAEDAKTPKILDDLTVLAQKGTEAKLQVAADAPLRLVKAEMISDATKAGVYKDTQKILDTADALVGFRREAETANILGHGDAMDILRENVIKAGVTLGKRDVTPENFLLIVRDVRELRDDGEKGGIPDAQTTQDLGQIRIGLDMLYLTAQEAQVEGSNDRNNTSVGKLVYQIDLDFAIAQLDIARLTEQTPTEKAKALGQLRRNAKEVGAEASKMWELAKKLQEDARACQRPNYTAKPEVLINELRAFRLRVVAAGHPEALSETPASIVQLKSVLEADAASINLTSTGLDDLVSKLMGIRENGSLIKFEGWQNKPIKDVKDAVNSFRAEVVKAIPMPINGTDVRTAEISDVITILQSQAIDGGIATAADLRNFTVQQLVNGLNAIRTAGEIFSLDHARDEDIQNVKTYNEGFREAAFKDACIENTANGKPVTAQVLVENINKDYAQITEATESKTSYEKLQAIIDYRREAGTIDIPNAIELPPNSAKLEKIKEVMERVKTTAGQLKIALVEVGGQPRPIREIADEIRVKADEMNVDNTGYIIDVIERMAVRDARIHLTEAHTKVPQPGIAEENITEVKNWDELTPDVMIHNLTLVRGGSLFYSEGKQIIFEGLLAEELTRINALPNGPEQARRRDVYDRIDNWLSSIEYKDIADLITLIKTGDIRTKAPVPEIQNAFVKLWNDINGKPGTEPWSRNTFREEEQYIYDFVYILAGKKRKVSSVGGTIA